MSQRVACSVCDLYEEGVSPPCHRCGHLGGDVLPGCMGSIHRTDLSGCYCVRPTKKDALVARIERLEARVQAIEDTLPGPDNGVDLMAHLATPTEQPTPEPSSPTEEPKP